MCRWPFIRKSGDDMGTFSKVSTSRACVRGAAVCGQQQGVELSRGPGQGVERKGVGLAYFPACTIGAKILATSTPQPHTKAATKGLHRARA